MLTLANCKLNKFYAIKSILDKKGERVLRRLYDLGFTPAQKVRVVRTSLSRGTYLIENRGYLVSLRADICDCIVVAEHD